MLGVEYELFDGTLLEIAILENIINTDNSTDFGLHLGVRRRF